MTTGNQGRRPGGRGHGGWLRLAAAAAIGLLTVVGGSGTAQAAQRGGPDIVTRSYFVTDARDNPVVGATVQLTPEAGGAPVAALTDDAGSVVLDARVLTPGAVYALRVLPPSGSTTLGSYDGGTSPWAGDGVMVEDVLITLPDAAPGTYGPYFWMHTPADPTDRVEVSVPAGGGFTVTGPASSDISGLVDPVYAVNFETPAPPAPPSGGGIGSGGDPGTAGGTTIVRKEVPATGSAWTTQITVPASTAPGAGYNVCVAVQASNGFGDLGCGSVTVLAAATDSGTPTATPTGTASSPGSPASTGTQPAATVRLASSTTTPAGAISFTGSGFTPGEQVNVIAHSTPVQLGTVTANAAGAVAGSVKLPPSFPLGAHSLELRGVSSGVAVSAAFRVGTVPAAATDMVAASDAHRAAPPAVAVVLAAVGLLGVLVRRRRRATT